MYGYKEITEVFEEAGFSVSLLEYHDEQGKFQTNEWNEKQAPIYRSSKLDHRNQDGTIRFASIILDAKK
ncbi:hypothetical protein VDG1235_2504 [Verrucomicrobiia bacterium DG1235]|nr:hypothetical protein VDG1235_2504 [Verrucomicrobiae bacterium DG1235]